MSFPFMSGSAVLYPSRHAVLHSSRREDRFTVGLTGGPTGGLSELASGTAGVAADAAAAPHLLTPLVQTFTFFRTPHVHR